MSPTLKPDSEATGRRVVVLVGLGFMGSHICRELSARGRAVRIFGQPGSSRELIRGYGREVEIVRGHIPRPQEGVGRIADADVVGHLGPPTVPGLAMNNPE